MILALTCVCNEGSASGKWAGGCGPCLSFSASLWSGDGDTPHQQSHCVFDAIEPQCERWCKQTEGTHLLGLMTWNCFLESSPLPQRYSNVTISFQLEFMLLTSSELG